MQKETLALMEEQIVRKLELTEEMAEDSKERAVLFKESMQLLEKLTAEERDQMEFEDKAARRRIDENRNIEMADIEVEKLNVNWKRMALEMSKIAIPVIVPLFAYDIFQRRVMKFEETGRITSTAGREMHLPKIFNK